MKRASLFILFTVLLAAGGCVSCKSQKNMAENAKNERTVKVGDTLRIRLKTNPSTGYSWHLADSGDVNVAAFVKNEIDTSYTPPKDMTGASIYQFWIFKGLAEGETDVELEYKREFGSAGPAKKKKYSIVVNK